MFGSVVQGVCVAGSTDTAGRAVELGVESADGVGLVGQAGVRVDVRGDGDVGVAEEFLDGDQWHTGFDQQRRAGVSEVVEADAADCGAVAEGLDAVGDCLGVEWGAEGPSRNQLFERFKIGV